MTGMTRQRLYQLRRLQKETGIMEDQLERLEKETRFYRELDPGTDPDMRSLRESVLARHDFQRCSYARRRCALEAELGALLHFIDRIPDTTLRQTFMLRYLDGLSWQQIANRMGDFSADTLRMRHDRFLRRQKGAVA